MAWPYFETPDRSERQQLLIHLLNNVEGVPYLRAPSGAGKTRFAEQLGDVLVDDFLLVWLQAQRMGPVEDELAAALGLEDLSAEYPHAYLALAGEQRLMVIVDEADHLELPAIHRLFELHDAGAGLLFVGEGGLAGMQGNWDLQFVDLPAFTEQQSLAFIEASGLMEKGVLSQDTAVGLHRAAAGLPGPLVSALRALPDPDVALDVVEDASSAAEVEAEQSPVEKKQPPWSMIAAGLLLFVVIVAGLLYQDEINQLFEPDVAANEEAPAVDEAASPVLPIGRPEAVVQSKPEPVAEPVAVAQEKPVKPQMAEPVTEPAGETAQTADAFISALLTDDSVLASNEVFEEPGLVPEVAKPVASSVQEAAAPVVPQDQVASADDILDQVMQEAIAAADDKAAPNPVEAEAVRPESSPASPVKNPAVPVEALDDSVVAEVIAEVAQPGPEVAEVPPVVIAEPEPEVAPKPVKPAPPPVARPVPRKSAASSDVAWLRSRQGGRYTLQLVGAREKAAIDRFIRRHGIERPYAVYQREMSGSPWYSLVAGDYRDRDEAVAVRDRMPTALAGSGVWPRTFASIHEQLR